MLDQVEAGKHVQDLKIDILQAICYVIRAWQEVRVDTIANCWQHTMILPANINADLATLSHYIRQVTGPEIDNLCQGLRALQLNDPMHIEEFLNLPEEEYLDEIPSMDDTIQDLIDAFKSTPTEENIDDSMEMPFVQIHAALEGLETAFRYLLQNRDHRIADHMIAIGGVEKFIQEALVASIAGCRL
jgi:hypothetical protein